MRHTYFTSKRSRASIGSTLGCLLMLVFLPARLSAPVTAQQGSAISPDIVVVPPGAAYRQTNFVSDVPGLASILDPVLVSPWGIAQTATSPFWVANSFKNAAMIYRGDVSGSPLVPNPGLAAIATAPGSTSIGPTGVVANTTSDFVVSSGSASGPARFIFASFAGTITGWNPDVPANSTVAQPAVTVSGHFLTGLAIGSFGGSNFLYAPNFFAPTLAGSIDVFNSTFALQSVASFPFTDTGVPALPADFRPFNIQNIGGSLYVA